MASELKIQVTSAAATHAGLVRNENQDTFLERSDIGLWVVADGMGGHENGAMASNLIKESLDQISAASSPHDLLSEVEKRLTQVNLDLVSLAATKGTGVVVASTVVILLVHSDQFVCAWAGDSRLYLLRGGSLIQISRDHSHVQEMVDEGRITAEEANQHPAANVVTRAIGGGDTIDIESNQQQLMPNDRFLLCSDGLTKMLSDAEIAHWLIDRPVENAVQTLIDLALDRGAVDNTTVVVVHANGTGNPASQSPPGRPTAFWKKLFGRS